MSSANGLEDSDCCHHVDEPLPEAGTQNLDVTHVNSHVSVHVFAHSESGHMSVCESIRAYASRGCDTYG
jgi:hypothetical protein